MTSAGTDPNVTITSSSSATGGSSNLTYLWVRTGTTGSAATLTGTTATYTIGTDAADYATAGTYYFNRYVKDATCTGVAPVAATGTYTLVVNAAVVPPGSCTYTAPPVVGTFANFHNTPEYGSSTYVSLTDERDAKIYPVVKIGGRWIMAQNLNYQKDLAWQANAEQPSTTLGRDLNLIGNFWCPGGSSSTVATSTQASCDVWGALYSWETAMLLDGYGTWTEVSTYNFGGAASATNSKFNHGRTAHSGTGTGGRGICPPNWHVPTDNEWGVILDGMESGGGTTHQNAYPTGWFGTDAGSRGKSVCIVADNNTSGNTYVNDTQTNWYYDSSTQGTDNYGFRVLPSGIRWNTGLMFYGRGSNTYFWSSSAYNDEHAWNRYFYSTYATVGRSIWSRSAGYSVRCIRDEEIPSGGGPQPQGGCTYTEPAPTGTFANFNPANSASTYISLIDERDGKVYPVVNLGGHWIMARNLNYQKNLTWQADAGQPTSSTVTPVTDLIGHFWCPGGNIASTSTQESCDVWGALYSWETAMMVDGKWTSSAQNSSSWSEPTSYTRVLDNKGEIHELNIGLNNARADDGAVSGGRGICPPNWHVPSYRDWGEIFNVMELPDRWGTINYNNGRDPYQYTDPVAGNRGRAKCIVADNGTTGDTYVNDSQANWYYYSGREGTDDYGFRALPAGYRVVGNDGIYNGIGVYTGRGGLAGFWSSALSGEKVAYGPTFLDYGDLLFGYYPNPRNWGLSVRCTWDFPPTAATTPPYAASTTTWTAGTMTVSDAIQFPPCNKTSFITSYDSPDCRSYTAGSATYYYYNWSFMKANEYLLCPSPWRVPTYTEYIQIYVYQLGCPTMCQWLGGGVSVYGEVVQPDQHQYLWAAFGLVIPDYDLRYYAYAWVGPYSSSGIDRGDKRAGLGIRCVK
jgi:uncharacterized protein (TIGR02145 family)